MSASNTPPPVSNAWSPAKLAERAAAARRPGDTPLVVVAAAVGGGAVIEPWLSAAGAPPIGLVAVSSALLIGWWIARSRRRDGFGAVALLLAVGSLAASWNGFAWREASADDLGRFARRDAAPVAIEAVATGPAAFYPAGESSPFRAIPSSDRSVVPVRVERIRDGVVWRPAAGRCDVTVIGRRSGIATGDRLRVFGQLRRPRPALNPGERDAARAALAEGRRSVITTEAPDCVTRLGAGSRFAASRLDAFRGRLRASVESRLSPEQAPVVAAMLLGDRAGLDRNVLDAFRRTGSLHVLVVSGLHMGLAAAVLLSVARLGLLGMRPALVLCVGVVIGYTALTGGEPPATRAAVLAVAACVAALNRRQALGANSLAGAAVAVFGASPGAWDSDGTRLSFLSAATLLAVARYAAWWNARPMTPLDRLIAQTRPLPERLALRLASWAGWLLVASAAVFLTTAPLLAYRFHLLSPIAAPMSLAVLPLVWFIVGGGLLMATVNATLAGWVPETLVDVAVSLPATVCDRASWMLVALVRTADGAPWASHYVAGPYGWQVAAWYALAAVTIATGVLLRGAIRWVFPRAALAAIAVGVTPSLIDAVTPAAAGPPALRCSFLAVGHGAATLLETPDGATILCDAGALRAPEGVTETIARALWARGVTSLDAIVLSHADVDHYNAVPGLLERFRVQSVWTSHLMLPRFADDTDSSGPAELRRVLEAADVPIRLLQTGDRIRVGDADDPAAVRIEVLHPSDLGVAGSDNANSLVLGVEHRGQRLLLTGDLESPGLDQVLAQEPYDCDVLVAPHHGSERSNPPGLAAWCRPELVVISSGDTRPGAGAAYRTAGAVVANTYESGMLSVGIDGAAVRLQAHVYRGK